MATDRDAEFREALKAVRNGSDKAAAYLVDNFGKQILVYVRRKLRSEALRAKFDSVDFVQSVWAAFFAVADRLDRFDSPELLTQYLIGIARNRLAGEFRRRFNHAKRNLNREVVLDEGIDKRSQEHAGKNKTASQLAIARETLQTLLEDRPKNHQRIITLRIAGYEYVEIGRMLDMDEGSVRRIVRNLRREFSHDD